MSVSDSVLLITSSDSANTTFGTGFVIHRNADEQASYLLTCAHVVRDVGGATMVCAAGRPATVVAYGDADGTGVDLAVVRVEGLPELPVLRLQAGAKEGEAFFATGFQVFRPNFLLRPINGTLGHRIELAGRDQAERTLAWDLSVTDSYFLQPGYSGSPVVRNGTDLVMAVVSSRIGDGQRGIAISIEGLKRIWAEPPIAIDPAQTGRPPSLSEEVWTVLLQRVRNGTCLPFLGAGASQPSLPLRADIARSWASQYGYPFANTGNLVEVAQFLAVKHQDPLFPKELLAEQNRKLAPPNFREPDEPHALLAELPFPVYMTTNYDDYMERALKAHYRDVRRQTCVWNDAILDETELEREPSVPNPIVFHLHGHLEYLDTGQVHGVESLVLTEDDYLLFLANMARDPGLLPRSIKRAVTVSTGLFIGYSLGDWDVRVLFQSLKQILRSLNVGVFLPPPGSAEEQKNAQEYLTNYYRSLNLHIYWGTAREFTMELRQRLEV